MEQKKFTFTLEIETVDRMNRVIYDTSPKYRSQSHFVEVALQKIIKAEEATIKINKAIEVSEEKK